MTFEAGQYRDPNTGRYRWAVLQSPSNVWHFPDNYGKSAAISLTSKLKRTVHN